jgi:hypothetical protein
METLTNDKATLEVQLSTQVWCRPVVDGVVHVCMLCSRCTRYGRCQGGVDRLMVQGHSVVQYPVWLRFRYVWV